MVLAENVHLSLNRYCGGADEPWQLAHLSLECSVRIKFKCVFMGEDGSHW